MNAAELLERAELAYHDIKTAADAIYYICDEYFGYTEAPDMFELSYKELSTRLRCAWLTLDYSVRDLAVVHGFADDHDIKKAVLAIQRAREVMGKKIVL